MRQLQDDLLLLVAELKTRATVALERGDMVGTGVYQTCTRRLKRLLEQYGYKAPDLDKIERPVSECSMCSHLPGEEAPKTVVGFYMKAPTCGVCWEVLQAALHTTELALISVHKEDADCFRPLKGIEFSEGEARLVLRSAQDRSLDWCIKHPPKPTDIRSRAHQVFDVPLWEGKDEE